MAGKTVSDGRDYAKWAFFAVMGLCALLVIWTDERFLVNPADPEWRHIAPFKWLLLPHGLFGATALCIGSLQFSDTLRRTRPAVHRWTGRIYIGGVAVASSLAFYFGPKYEPQTIHIEQYFSAGLWFATTAIALAFILGRQIAFHKLWMMRSYGLALAFILSRVPDAFMHMNDQQLADVLWSLLVAGLLGPDVILTVRELTRGAARRRSRSVAGKPQAVPAA